MTDEIAHHVDQKNFFHSVTGKVLICILIVSLSCLVWWLFFNQKVIAVRPSYLASEISFKIVKVRGPNNAKADDIVPGNYTMIGWYASSKPLKITFGVSGKTISFTDFKQALRIPGRRLGPMASYAFMLPSTNQSGTKQEAFSVKFHIAKVEANAQNVESVACGFDSNGNLLCPVETSLPLRVSPNGSNLPSYLEVTVDDDVDVNPFKTVSAAETIAVLEPDR
jgi:hypothetical protein